MVKLPMFIRKMFSVEREAIYETFTTPQTLKMESIGYGGFDFADFSDTVSGYYNNNPKVKSAMISTSGQIMADGIFLTPAMKRDASGKMAPYDRAEEARTKCEDLNDRLRINELGFAIVLRMVKYGSCFLEKTSTPQFDVRLIPNQKYIKPKYDGAGNQVGWRLHYRGSDIKTWAPDELIHIPLFPDENTPYGTSIAAGIGTDIDSYEHIMAAFNKYAERQAIATDVVQIGDKDYVPGADEMSHLRRNVMNRTIGQTIFTNYTIGKQTLGGGALESNSVPKMIDFLDKRVTDGLMAPTLSSLVSSTEASATQVMAWLRATLITPIQAVLSVSLQKELYWPYLEGLGYSVKVIPDVNFNSAEAGKNKEADYWLKLVQAKIASPRQAAKEVGIEWDKEWWEKEAQAGIDATQVTSGVAYQGPRGAGAKAPGAANAAAKVGGDVVKQAQPPVKTGPKPDENTGASK